MVNGIGGGGGGCTTSKLGKAEKRYGTRRSQLTSKLNKSAHNTRSTAKLAHAVPFKTRNKITSNLQENCTQYKNDPFNR